MYLILNRYHVHICRHHSLRKHVTCYPAGLRTGLCNCITNRDYVIPQTGDLISTSLIRYIVGIPYVLLKSGKKRYVCYTILSSGWVLFRRSTDMCWLYRHLRLDAIFNWNRKKWINEFGCYYNKRSFTLYFKLLMHRVWLLMVDELIWGGRVYLNHVYHFGV